MKSLIGDSGNPEAASKHKLRSSNLPFYETIWNVAKRTGKITGLRQRFKWDEPACSESSSAKQQEDSDQIIGDATKSSNIIQQEPIRLHHVTKRVDIDVVADHGAEWIKVSLITEKQLLYDLARQGWTMGDESDSEDTQHDSPGGDDAEEVKCTTSKDAECDIQLLRTAKHMVSASKQHWHHFSRPRTRLILPRIHHGRVLEIDKVVDCIRVLGCQVDLASDPISSDHPKSQNLAFDISHLGASYLENFSPALNIDCSILIAIISDVSHTIDFKAQPWFDRNIRQFVELEARERLLLTYLYPAMSERKLFCTEEAADKTREIAQTLGTDTEKRRAEILLCDCSQMSAEEARPMMAVLSDHPIPEGWQIPINVVQAEKVEPEIPNFPVEVAERVGSYLSPLNRSVFLYGWRSGHTTLTSNRAVARQIEALVRECIDNGDGSGKLVRGPHIWVNMKARSLVGREKESSERGRGRKSISNSKGNA